MNYAQKHDLLLACFIKVVVIKRKVYYFLIIGMTYLQKRYFQLECCDSIFTARQGTSVHKKKPEVFLWNKFIIPVPFLDSLDENRMWVLLHPSNSEDLASYVYFFN